MSITVNNMSMPKCCSECRFQVLGEPSWEENYSTVFCAITEKEMDYPGNPGQRPSWCPLEDETERGEKETHFLTVADDLDNMIEQYGSRVQFKYDDLTSTMERAAEFIRQGKIVMVE